MLTLGGPKRHRVDQLPDRIDCQIGCLGRACCHHGQTTSTLVRWKSATLRVTMAHS